MPVRLTAVGTLVATARLLWGVWWGWLPDGGAWAVRW